MHTRPSRAAGVVRIFLPRFHEQQERDADTVSNESLFARKGHAIPGHIGIIIDGNGRWAQAQGLPRQAGHKAGADNIRSILTRCVEYGVNVLTIYAFSTENWHRPPAEVHNLLALVEETLQQELPALHQQGVRLWHSGSLAGLSPTLQHQLRHAQELTQHNERLILNLAVNYGGRADIVAAVRRALADGLDPAAVTEQRLRDYLSTAALPDLDLLIRTGGEMRLSNFLLWEAAYAACYATPLAWPDFDATAFDQALLAYHQRSLSSTG